MAMSWFKGLVAVAVLCAAPAWAGVSKKYREASEALVQAGYYAENAEGARDLFERALAADPGNVNALVGLGRAHEDLGRVGTGLKYYRRALTIEPNHRRALEAQALAFLKKDSLDKAERNRARLERICGRSGCDELDVVTQAISAHLAGEVAIADPEPEPGEAPDPSL